MLSSLVPKIQKRLVWSAYLRNIDRQRRHWDAAESAILPEDLKNSCVFDTPLPPYLQGEGSIFSDPSVVTDVITARRAYLYHFKKNVVIEPEFGYVIGRPESLIYLSLPGSEWVRQKKTMQFFSGLPSLEKFRAAKHARKEKLVVSLRYVFEGNYYHFFLDVMSKLKIFDNYGLHRATPLVISPQIARQKFFQEFVRRGNLAERNWLVQDDFYIEADEVLFAKADAADRVNLDHFLACADAPAADLSAHRRVFLTRDPKNGRNIRNMNEILPVLSRFNFEVVDAAQMTIEEQMTIFSQTEVLVAIHGAGITNIIFRRGGPLVLLEIFPPSETLRCFYELAKMYGFQHRYIRGNDPADQTRFASFYLDPKHLEDQLRQL